MADNNDSGNTEGEAAKAGATAEHEDGNNASFGGVDIKALLSSTGPVVKTVILRHMSPSGKDLMPHPVSPQVDGTHMRRVITELVDEIEIDTTPSKSMVKQVLGGPITFIGQYADEGIVVVARREVPGADVLNSLSVLEIKSLCKEYSVDTSGMIEKSEMVEALMDSQLPVNPHVLQPPFDKQVIRGDILLMRIAETDEVLDADGAEDGAADDEKAVNGDGKVSKKPMKIEALPNEEFFLNYTKKEWVVFASRTDVVAPDLEGEDEDDEDDENYAPKDDDDDDDDNEEEHEDGEGDDEEDDEFVPGEEDMDDEESRRVMLHVILSEVIKQFREDNGRGPDSDELLDLRAQVAEQLGVQLPSVDPPPDKGIAKKRSLSDGDQVADQQGKKVKFDPSFVNMNEDDDENNNNEDDTDLARESKNKNEDNDDEEEDGKPAAIEEGDV
jgi:hypothetical protein